ncbi:MAG: uridine kinase [Bacilli bacterium]
MSYIILIGGGSASGKTYVISQVEQILGKENITHISLDDYYKRIDSLSFEERKLVNYDHPKSFDWKLIREQLHDLKEGKTIEKPLYDFVIHNRKQETEKVSPKKIVIVEGIMALVDKEVRNVGDLKIFINASRERRLLRRINRDQKERGRDFDGIVKQYLTTVQPMYEEIIGPSQVYADIIINNDGIENKSVKSLVSIIREYLEH